MQSLKQFSNYVVEDTQCYFNFDDPDWQDWLKSEGFDYIDYKCEDSYTYMQLCDHVIYDETSHNYWYWASCISGWMFRIYVFRDLIICEKEYDCGGFAGSRYFDVKEYSMTDIWDQIIDYIKFNIQL